MDDPNPKLLRFLSQLFVIDKKQICNWLILLHDKALLV